MRNQSNLRSVEGLTHEAQSNKYRERIPPPMHVTTSRYRTTGQVYKIPPSISARGHPASQPGTMHTGPQVRSNARDVDTTFRVFPRCEGQWSSSQSSTLKSWSVRSLATPAPNEAPNQASASGPAQPPALLYSQYIPLPSQSRVPPQLHPILRYTTTTEPLLDIDLSTSPLAIQAAAQTLSGHRLARYLRDPATQPPIPSLTIMHPQLPRGITVHYSSISPGCVTLADVLQTICTVLQRPMDEGDLMLVSSAQQSHKRGLSMTAGGEKRWIRLDCLLGKHRLIGLDTTPCDGDTENELYE